MNRVEFKALDSIIVIEFSGRPSVEAIDVVTETGQALEFKPGVFRGHLTQLLKGGTRCFVVDVSRYRVDTMVLGELVGMYKRIVTDYDGWLGIVQGDTHQTLFAATKLDTVFRLFDQRKDAIASAEAWRPNVPGPRETRREARPGLKLSQPRRGGQERSID